MKKICVVIVDRANYGRLKPVMKQTQQDSELELQVLCAGTTLLERYGNTINVIQNDGFEIDDRVYLEVEGSSPATMSKSIGLGLIEFSSVFQRLAPDVVLIIGDRYEALAATIAAAYQNISVAHIQGGEVSGSIDESARHAITKFSHLHFPSTERAAEYIVNMGEDPAYVKKVGCPCGDYILGLDDDIDNKDLELLGVGNPIDLSKPYFLVIFHPVTTEYGSPVDQTEELLNALDTLGQQTLWIWPNIDAGSDRISKAIRRFREHKDPEWLFLVKNFEPDLYQKLLKCAACLVGNSSSFVRDSTFSGTPVVLVGNRQVGRECGANVLSTQPVAKDIIESINHQLDHGRYPMETLYGDGTASVKIIEELKLFQSYQQKRLNYVKA